MMVVKQMLESLCWPNSGEFGHEAVLAENERVQVRAWPSQNSMSPRIPSTNMTTSKYQESVKELSSSDDSKRLKALRFIKNSVIGNKTKKDLYIKLGVVQKYVSVSLVHQVNDMHVDNCAADLDLSNT